MRVIGNRIDRTIDEGQPCEQAGFRRGFSTIDRIHTVIRLIEVSREYKTPLCLTFIDLKKAVDSVETEANIMWTLEWDVMGVKIDGRQLHHLRFADDIVLINK
ncbi:hypothetical protein Q1695_009071 [Nippostrongylus brasiliensis]|nr:hypothetical protein Q1695_009071 [Nippostrongylus brasiliensis]